MDDVDTACGGGPMLLVPRQLRRAGLTGDVPYYGGRFTPAQAYAASHPSAPPPESLGRGSTIVRTPMPEPARPIRSKDDTRRALEQLRDDGVISPEEYDDLRSRMSV
jgi:hypothetical protein